MLYLLKHDVSSPGTFAVIRANCESCDIRYVKILRPKTNSNQEIVHEIRKAYFLADFDSVTLDYQGNWDGRVEDGYYTHPFLEGMKVKAEIVR